MAPTKKSQPSNVRVTFRAEIQETEEFENVPRAKLKATVRRLRRDPEAGKPLERELAGCRSIRPDGVTNRVVYQILEDGALVEIIAIGRRRDDEVYNVAYGRL